VRSLTASVTAIVLVGVLLLSSAVAGAPSSTSSTRDRSELPVSGGPATAVVTGSEPASVPTDPVGGGGPGRVPSVATLPPSVLGRPLDTTPVAEGVEYSGPSSIASSVGVDLRVPDDLPAATDRYYVAVSAFDGAESYDQVGLANDNGSWQVYYGAASTCGTRPDTHWNAFGLSRGAMYRFSIAIETGGEVVFAAFTPAGTSVWQETVHTGATYFALDGTMVCGSATVPGYTETQEVYATAFANPPYNFVLTNATEDGTPETDWLALPGAADPGAIARNGSNVTIFNQPFTISFGPSGDSLSLETTGFSQILRLQVEVQVQRTTTTPIEVQNYTVPSGWSFTAAPFEANASFSSNVTIGVPAGVTPGLYVVGLQAVNSSGLPNRIALVLTVLDRLVLMVVGRPTSGAIDANETATFDPNASGGLPAYAYIWPNLPAGCNVTDAVAVCRFASAGNFSLDVGVEDALHYAWYQNETYQVLRDPRLSAPPGDLSLSLGGSLQVALLLSGGLSPYAIDWLGLPPGCSTVNGTSLTCLPTSAGHYAVTVVLTDATGFQTSLPLAVTITTSAAAATLPLETIGLAFVAAGLLVLIAACGLLLLRRRRAR
jgi:hypothetical protein